MIDLLRLTVPFSLHAVSSSGKPIDTRHALATGCEGVIKDMLRYTEKGTHLGARQVYRDEQGQLVIQSLHHSIESLPSSFSGFAFQMLTVNGWPHVVMKGSPAKLLQGHNVFGPMCIKQAAYEFLGTLAAVRPDVFADLDVSLTEVTNIDITFSARYAHPESPQGDQIGRDLVTFLRTLAAGQLKPRNVSYDTTVYWGGVDSKLGGIKAYLKFDEFMSQFRDVCRDAAASPAGSVYHRQKAVMEDARLQHWAKNLLRLEASFKKDWLRRHEIPTNLEALIRYQEEHWAQGRCFLQEIWAGKTAPLFRACEGQTMKVIDDKHVELELQRVHVRYTKSGKVSYSHANALMDFYRAIKDYGFAECKKRYASSDSGRRTFYNRLNDLEEAGISRAMLQTYQLNSSPSNVMPLIRFVAVDFGAQRPDWYREPVSEFSRGQMALFSDAA